MCSKIVNGVETVWDCGFSKQIQCGWRCEVCGEHAGGSIRHFDVDGNPIESRIARNLIALGGSTQYFDRNGRRTQPKGWDRDKEV